MAVVGRRADRGQLLVITAVSLALLVTLMALALNTAVFGEVHVAQTDDTLHEERAVVRFEDDVQRGVGGLLPAYRDETGIDEATLGDAYGDDVATWSELTASHYARDSAGAEVRLERAYFGSFALHDNESRTFTSDDGNTTWTVAADADRVVSYEMNVSGDQLAQTGECNARDECFHLVVDGGSWEMAIYDKSGQVSIEVNGAEVCRTNSSFVPIDHINGSFGVQDCSSGFATFQDELDGPYTLEYASADRATGTYELVVDGDIAGANYHDPGTDRSPRRGPSIVAADVTVRYRSTELAYERQLRVTPGETDG